MNLKKSFLIALGAGALAVPAAALAHPGGDHGHGHGNGHGNGHGHGGNPTVTYVFKGTYGGDGLVVVQARLPKQDPGAQPFAAQRLVDQTSPPDDSDDDG